MFDHNVILMSIIYTVSHSQWHIQLLQITCNPSLLQATCFDPGVYHLTTIYVFESNCLCLFVLSLVYVGVLILVSLPGKFSTA
jgi:hypothetical protein